MQDSKTMLAMCEEQEERFQFDHFSRADALALGLKLHENAGKQPIPVAIEITVNGLTVFRYFPDGALPDSELWLQRKRRTVDLMHMSSLRFLAWLEENGETMEEPQAAGARLCRGRRRVPDPPARHGRDRLDLCVGHARSSGRPPADHQHAGGTVCVKPDTGNKRRLRPPFVLPQTSRTLYCLNHRSIWMI